MCVILYSREGKVFRKASDMIRKYHNHTLQINPRTYEEESQNTDCHKVSSKVKHPHPALSG